MLRRLPNLTNTLVLAGSIALGLAMCVPTETAQRAARVETRAEEAGRALLAAALATPIGSESLADARANLLRNFRAACEQLGHPNSYLPEAKDPPPSLDGLDCALFESKHYCFMLVRGDSQPMPEPPASQPSDRPASRLESNESQPTAEPEAESTKSRPEVRQPTAEISPTTSRATTAATVESAPPRPAPSTIRPLEVYAWPRTLLPPGITAFFFPSVGDPAFSRNLMHQYVGWDETRRRAEMPRPGAGVPKKPREGRGYRGRDDERWLVFFGRQ